MARDVQNPRGPPDRLLEAVFGRHLAEEVHLFATYPQRFLDVALLSDKVQRRWDLEADFLPRGAEIFEDVR